MSSRYSLLSFCSIIRESTTLLTSEEIKEKMVELCASRLPPICGDRYAAVVMRCLNCVEEDAARHRGDENGNQEVEVGMTDMAVLSASAERSESRRPQAKVYLQSVLEDLDEIIV